MKRIIQVNFMTESACISYEIDVVEKHFKMGKMENGAFTEITQEADYDNSANLLQQITTLIAIELARNP